MSSNTTSATSIMSSATKAPKSAAKTVTKKTEEVAVAAAAPAPVAAAAPKVSKKAAASAAATAAPAVPAAPVAASAAPVEAAAATEAVEEVRLEAEVKAMTARLLAVRETVSELISEAKRLEKKAAKVRVTATTAVPLARPSVSAPPIHHYRWSTIPVNYSNACLARATRRPNG